MKKRVALSAGIIVALVMMVVFVRNTLGIRPIKSGVAGYEEIGVEILIRDEGSDREYDILNGNSIVLGEIEAVAKPLGDDEAYTYVEYKINGFNYVTGYSPSYGVKINTRDLPDGWNQLLVVGYKESDRPEGVKQIIFRVDNNKEKIARAPRRGIGYGLGEVPLYKRDYIPVLMYHDFQEKITKEQESGVVHPELFEEQLKKLLESDYTPINFQDLFLYMNGKGGLPAKPVIITADDGYLSNYETAFPILEKYKVPATFFITSRYVGVETSSPHFTWEQAKKMEASGLIDIQSHTHGHLLLNTIPDDEIRNQVDISFGLIEQNLGKRDVQVLAYPQFYHNSHTKKILSGEGVNLQITNLAKWYKATTKPTNIQRIHVSNDTSPEDLIKKIKKLTH